MTHTILIPVLIIFLIGCRLLTTEKAPISLMFVIGLFLIFIAALLFGIYLLFTLP